MYVVKVGDFYIQKVDVAFGGYVGTVALSKEKMREFATKSTAERIAKLTGGKVLEIENVGFEQISLFDKDK